MQRFSCISSCTDYLFDLSYVNCSSEPVNVFYTCIVVYRRIGLCSVLRPLQHSIGYMGDGVYTVVT